MISSKVYDNFVPLLLLLAGIIHIAMGSYGFGASLIVGSIFFFLS